MILSMALIFFTVYLAPNRFQSIYWRTGIFTYTLPSVLGTGLLALLSSQLKQSSANLCLRIITPLLAFMVAAFSEAAGATLTSIFILITAAELYYKLRKRTWSRAVLSLSLEALGAALLALVVMALSPANQARQIDAYPRGYATPLHALALSFRFAWDFIFQ